MEIFISHQQIKKQFLDLCNWAIEPQRLRSNLSEINLVYRLYLSHHPGSCHIDW